MGPYAVGRDSITEETGMRSDVGVAGQNEMKVKMVLAYK